MSDDPLSADATVITAAVPRMRVAGYWLVIAGVVGFAISIFLPMFSIPSGPTMSLFSRTGSPIGGLGLYGPMVKVFMLGGVLVLLVATSVALRGERTWGRPALIAASAVWLMTWSPIPVFWRSVTTGDEFIPSEPLLFGYWCFVASIVLVALGTLLVCLPGRREPSPDYP